MPTALSSYVDLSLTSGTYRYTDREDVRAPLYRERLLSPLRIVKTQGDLFYGFQQPQEVSIELSNIDNSDTVAPSLARIFSTEDPLGQRARAWVYDWDNNAEVVGVDGVLVQEDMDQTSARLLIAAPDLADYEVLLPKKLIIDIYPNADLTTTPDETPPVIVVFGVARRMTLALVASTISTWDYGPIRKPASGTFAVNTIYRDGKIASSSEYTLVETPSGYYVIRFTLDQRDLSGKQMKIQGDFTSTEFGDNPANVVKFLLSDSTYGLGKSVNATSFTNAAADYTSLSYKVAGGLDTRIRAFDLLQQLLLHGAMLEINSSGEYTLSVDMLAAHTTAPIKLGQGYPQWENIVAVRSDASKRLEERIKKLTLRGLLDPGFQGNGSPLLTAVRERSSTRGRELEVLLPFVADATTIDTECDYRFKALTYADKSLTLAVDTSARVLALRQTVQVYIPNLFHSGTQYQVWALEYDGGQFAVSLVGYDPLLFTYQTATAVVVAPGATTISDYSATAPAAPTSPQFISSTVTVATDGGTTTIEKFRVTLPAVNCTELHAYAYRAGTGQITPFTNVFQKNVTLGAANDIEIEVPSGTNYDIEFYSYNGDNRSNARYSAPALITSRVAAGDTTGPGLVTGLALADQPPRALKASWTAPSDKDVQHFRVEVGFDPSFASWTYEFTAKTTSQVIGDLQPGSTYYVRVRAEDWSNNPGAWSSVVGITITRLATNDYGVSSVTDDRIVSLGSTKITGSLTINPSGNIPALTITNGGDIHLRAMSTNPSRIVFENDSGVPRARITGDASNNLTIDAENGGGSLRIGVTSSFTNISLTSGAGGMSLLSGAGVDLTAGTFGSITLAAPSGRVNVQSSRLYVSGNLAGCNPTAITLLPLSTLSAKAYLTLEDAVGNVYGLIPIV